MRKFGISLMAASLAWLSAPVPSHAAQTITTDLIVQGSECVGVDCTSSESFGFDTLRLKENNLRINFNDTSSSGSFPSNDWRIVINDTTNGGGNYFAIEDSTASRIPFRIEAGAIANALYVDSAGDVGIGTATPVVELHAVDGNTPTLRLEQNGSSGFTPQTWDLAGNEANFFIRDVTNGSKLPFRIEPNTPENTLYLDSTGNISIGDTSPGSKLEVNGSDATVVNAGAVRLNLQNTTKSTWSLNSSNAGNGNLTFSTGAAEMTLEPTTGNLTILGSLTANNGMNTFPDYVFGPDYALMPLSDLESFVKENGHLPNIPSQGDINGQGGKINMTEMQLKLLEKVEELTLYTLAQEKTINELHARLASLEQTE